MSDLNFEPPGTQPKKPAAKPGRKPNNAPKAKDKSLIGLRRAVAEAVSRLNPKSIVGILDTARRVMADYDISWYIAEGNQTPAVIEGQGLLWRFNAEIIGADNDVERTMPVSIITPLDIMSPVTARLHAEIAFVQAFFALYTDFNEIFAGAAAAQNITPAPQPQEQPTAPVASVPEVPSRPAQPTINHPDKTHSTGFPNKIVEDILQEVRPDGVYVFRTPYESPHDVATNVGVIVALTRQFIDKVDTSSALQVFGDDNNEAFTYLKDFDKVSYDQVMREVQQKWKQLTGG